MSDSVENDAVDVVPFLKGAVQTLELSGGLVQPYRFFPKQMETLEQCGRGKRAVATAGVVIDLVTDGDEVSFDCEVTRALDMSHHLVAEVMGHTGGIGVPEDGVVDGIDLVVQDTTAYTVPARDGRVTIGFENPGHERVEVRIYLPVIMSVAVGNLSSNGSLEPAPRRDWLLALGDSITQGFVVGCPSQSWPAILASSLGLDLLNQAVAGHGFDKATLRGLGPLRENPPKAIAVAYGTNDWSRKTSARQIERDATEYLEKLAWRFPESPIYVLSPVWRADFDESSPSGITLPQLTEMLYEICERHETMRFVNGLDLLPRTPMMFADDRLHPGSVGASIIADGMLSAMDDAEADGLVSADVPARRSMAWSRGFVDLSSLKEEPTGDAGPSAIDAASEAMAEGFAAVTDRIASSMAQRATDETASAVPVSGETTSVQGEGPVADADRQTLGREGCPQGHPDFDALVRTIWRLRQPDGCPWDKVQTHESIQRNMIEEAYEAVGAIDDGDADHLREELGDVLMQVLLHSQIDADAGGFSIDDVCREVNEKLVRRHPHVFGEGVEAADAEDVLGIWSQVKLQEHKDANASADADAETGASSGAGSETGSDAETKAAKGLLDDVPRAMPALMQCQKISKKAAACGFEWETVRDVWAKVAEEKGEYLSEKPGTDAASMEFGDLLFALVNVARRDGIDAEEALRGSCEKFRRRWSAMENASAEQGRDISEASTGELNELWDRAKNGE